MSATAVGALDAVEAVLLPPSSMQKRAPVRCASRALPAHVGPCFWMEARAIDPRALDPKGARLYSAHVVSGHRLPSLTSGEGWPWCGRGVVPGEGWRRGAKLVASAGGRRRGGMPVSGSLHPRCCCFLRLLRVPSGAAGVGAAQQKLAARGRMPLRALWNRAKGRAGRAVPGWVAKGTAWGVTGEPVAARPLGGHRGASIAWPGAVDVGSMGGRAERGGSELGPLTQSTCVRWWCREGDKAEGGQGRVILCGARTVAWLGGGGGERERWRQSREGWRGERRDSLSFLRAVLRKLLQRVQ